MLSRFSKQEEDINKKPQNKVLAIVSGPETQRTIFEEILVEQLNKLPYSSILLRGLPNEKEIVTKGKVEMHPHKASEELNEMILDSEYIISRSGYSTVMDLVALGKKGIFIPTPGQAEQEYLANKYNEEKLFQSFPQDEFHLKTALENDSNYKGIPEEKLFQTTVLDERIIHLKTHVLRGK